MWDFNDLLWGDYEDDLLEIEEQPVQERFFEQNELDFEQALISHKREKENFIDISSRFYINRDLINSERYHDKFEQMPLPKSVRQSLYIQTGRLLEFSDGHAEEHMLAVNARTGEFIADNFKKKGREKSTSFDTPEYLKVRECKDGVILMHNHSENGRPTYKDISVLLEESVKASIIACHDGIIYGIFSVNKKIEEIYQKRLDEYKTRVNDIEIAKSKALSDLYDANDKSERHRIFDCRRL